MIRWSVALAMLVLSSAHAQDKGMDKPMGFFVTSVGGGKGADFGGLSGADAHCQSLAAAAGAGNRTWRAYLSADAADGKPAVNARERIGRGPWYNAKGVLIAASLEDLHGPKNAIGKQTALTEAGAMVNGRGDRPNMHDILTGSDANGMLVVGKTCASWTSGGEGSTVVGHHDRMGSRDDAPSKSWNASHATRGCSLDLLKSTGGNGLLYCFAAD